MPPTPMTTPTLIVTLLIYALGIGAAALLDNARGTGSSIAIGVVFGMLLHAIFHFGYLARESRNPK